MTKKASAIVIALSTLWIAELGAQSGGRDLPPAFRSVAGVTLNRDSAATIRAKLGATRERRVGTEHDTFASWCYVPTEASSRALLELMSDASDLGTPGHALNVIRLREAAPSDDRRACAPLRASTGLSTPGGLRLGLSAAEIEHLLGLPRRRSADSLAYYFDAKEYLRSENPEYEKWNTPERRETCFDAGLPYANVAATVVVLLRDGRAVEIRIERYDQAIC